MSVVGKITRSNFFIKLRSWEYWPFGIIQAPLFIYWMWLSLKTRSLLFFSASNPGILTGGMFGESKFDVLQKIPAEFKPKGILIKKSTPAEEVIQKIQQIDLSLPIIFKPDIGERGWRVKKIKSNEEIIDYVASSHSDFIIQEYIHYPLEFSVFYHRLPNEERGKVTSVTLKQMLTITGDGVTTIQDLILSKDRAKLQWEVLRNTFKINLIPSQTRVKRLS